GTDDFALPTEDFASTDDFALPTDDSFNTDDFALPTDGPANTDDFTDTDDFSFSADDSFDIDDDFSSVNTGASDTDDFSFSMNDASDDDFNFPEDETSYQDYADENTKKSFTDTPKSKSSTKIKKAPKEKSSSKNYSVPMIVCIVCTILCIAAVIIAFAFGAWPGENDTAVNNIVTVEPPEAFTETQIANIQQGTEVLPPPTPEENTIEIINEPEIIPTKPEPAADIRSENIRYRLVWGDTLWDLSDTYYRNPWLYPIIAKENNIANPDIIIAGTYIEIPPQ
ncbi:MAG: LysM peptidoglycan-binding domain-containing protein, partial [Spirochaetales bacterium]